MANLLSDADVFGSAPSGLLSDADVFGKGAKTEPGGFVASAKQALGAGIKGAGQAAADFIPGVSQENALKRYGQEIIEANPTAVHSFSDLADKPWTAVKEATGNALSSMGGVVGARALGTGITAAAPLAGPAAPIVAGAGQAISWLGPVAAAALPSFGGIREQQIHDDPNATNSAAAKAAAAVGAGTVGAIESRFGPEAWGSKMLTEAGRNEVAKLFAAKTLPQAVAKGAVRGAAVEGAEELAQNPVEQLAAFQNPLTAEALKDTAFSGAMGALGGGVLGGGTGAASRYLPKKPDVAPGNQPAEPPKAPPAPTYTGTPGDQTLQATVDRQNAVDAAQAATDALYNEHDAFERERAANMGGPTEPPSTPGDGIDFTPPQLPDTGPLSRAANISLVSSSSMERRALFPFASFDAAEMARRGRADLVSRPHPTVPGRFALVPSGMEAPRGTGSFADQSELANFIADERKDQSARRAAIAEWNNNAIAQADQAVSDARQFATRNERLSILDGVLSSLAPGQNPNRRFDAALKAAGFRDTSFTEEERTIIGRYGNAASAFAEAPTTPVEPSSPNEMGDIIPAAPGKGNPGIAGAKIDRVRSAIAAGFTQRKGFSLINPATGEKFALKTPGMIRAAKEALEKLSATNTENRSDENTSMATGGGEEQRPEQIGSQGNLPTVAVGVGPGDYSVAETSAPSGEPAVSVGDGSERNAALSEQKSTAKPRRTRMTPLDDPRISKHAESLQAMAGDVGWAETGGLLLRDANGKANGRTQWIPHAEWFRAGMIGRPEDAMKAVQKAVSGEPMSVKEKRTIQGMMDWLDHVDAHPNEAEALADMGYDDLTEPEQEARDALGDFDPFNPPVGDVAAGMRALGFTEEEIRAEIEGSQSRDSGQGDGVDNGIAGRGPQESLPGRDETRPSASEGQGPDERPSLELERQTDQGLADKAAREQEPQEPTKEQADRERDAAPFSLSEQSQPKPQGVQSGLFTADGRVSVEAKQPEKPAEVTKPKNEQREAAGLPAATDGGSRPVPAVSALEETFRPLIERLIRNKRVAKELGFDIDGAIAKAKAAMAGTKQMPGSFRALAKRAEKKGDTETAAILNQIADLNDGRKAKAAVVKDSLTAEPAGNQNPIKKDDGASTVDPAAHEAASSPKNDKPEPTDAQKEAGNYAKGHIRIAGLDISIENPEGSIRSGTDKGGKSWSITMKSHYGYLKGTIGKDKDHIDVFVKPGTAEDYSGDVFIIDQKNAAGGFDEHKVMLGWGLQDAAVLAYKANYTPGWDGIRAVTPMSMEQFKGWLENGNHQEPAAASGKTPLQQDIAKLKPNVELKKGDRFKDGQGKTWEVWTARTSLVEAFPVIDGKIKVSRDDGMRFATDERARLANPEARTDVFPLPKDKAPVTPQLLVGNPERYIKVAADSIKDLRKVDVYRVLVESNRPEFRLALADYIRTNRPDLAQEVESVLAEAKAEDEARNDRDHFTLDRLNRETNQMEQQTFKRGEYVRYTLNGKDVFGDIDGISHAKREFSVDGLWYPFGFAYKAERPEAPKPKTVSLSSVIDKVNAKHGKGLTEADRVPSLENIIDQHTATMAKLADGTLTLDQYRAAFATIVENKDAVSAELSKLTKDAIFKRFRALFYRYKNDPKPEIIKAAYRSMMDDFVLSDSIQWSMGQKYEDVIRGYVDAATPESLAAYAEKLQAANAEREQRREEIAKAIADPQTLEDYRRLLQAKVDGGKTADQARMELTPAQRVALDNLWAEDTRSRRSKAGDARKTDVQAAARTSSGDIIETKHTKTGEPLFVVKAAERVEREVYNEWNANAKRLGGWYSSFRGSGAIPGFQFKSRENAAAFLQYLGGDVTAAKEAIQERRDAFADDRSQSAVERLNEMADRLEERADESLAVKRKANTARRARFAASAEAAASGDKAMARTMRNIADAIAAGTAKFLDRVRQKVQVEMLRSTVASAKYDELRQKYPSYVDQEKHRGEKPTAETADYARWPRFTADRADLARLGRDLLQIDGAKQLGNSILKVADDVTEAYKKFAKENLHKVSVFSAKREGSEEKHMAVFPTADRAEAVIARSGFKGKATTISFKRGEHLVIMGPEMAREAGLWHGDPDKRITLTPEAGEEIVAKVKALGKGKVAMPYVFENVANERARWKAIGIETAAEQRAALREFIALQEAPAAPDRIKQMEREMIGRKNDGLDFFPTPAATAQAMIEAADIKEGMSVLEPSAGMGHIAEQIRDVAGVEPDVIEFSGDRRELLEAKGFNVVGSDFMDMNSRGFTYGDVFRTPDGTLGVMRGSGGLGSNRVGLDPLDANGQPDPRRAIWTDRDELVGVEKRASNSGYDRIIMNPPFSNRRDAEHVQHAYSLLKPGGRLVAIMGEGVFYGQDKKAQAFRDWMESVGGTSEKLEEGTFLDPSLPVNTGVNARMVVIDAKETEKGIALFRNEDGQAIPESEWLSVGAITDQLEQLREPFGTAIPVTIIDRVSDIGIESDPDDGVTSGVTFKGTIHLVREGLVDSAAVARTFWHELLHFGLRRFMTRAQYIEHLGRLYASDGWVRHKADQWIAGPEGRALHERGDSDGYIRARGVDEALAALAETLQSNPTGYRNNGFLARAIRSVRSWVADVAEFFGFHDAAQAWRSFAAQDQARDLVVSTFARLRDGAPPSMMTTNWHYSDPAFMVAWHGSPHDHDGFSADRIGSGEGAQAYGWGLYFASERAVAEHYRHAGRYGDTFEYGKTIKDIRANLKERHGTGNFRVTRDGEIHARDDDGMWKFKGWVPPAGKLYKVELAPSEDEYLDWDKPLSEQSEFVQKSIRPLVKSFANDLGEKFSSIWNDYAGTFYQYLARSYTAKAASGDLYDVGIRGIRYLDGSSRSHSEGSHNYVIFDDADVTITGKESRAPSFDSSDAPQTTLIRRVVDSFLAHFQGAAALDIRVVTSRNEIPLRYRPSPYAEGVYHDADGVVYLISSNLPTQARAWQVLMHEAIGHYGLSNLMGEKFAALQSTVLQKATTGRELSRHPQPGEADYATVEAVRRLYPEASDSEVAQEVLARMAEMMDPPGWSKILFAQVRHWLRTAARAMNLTVEPSLQEAKDAVVLAAKHLRDGKNLEREMAGEGQAFASEGAPRLAPNGKPSRLNAHQWKQVRTPEFKAWFGDWEAASLKTRIMASPISVASTAGLTESGSYKDLRTEAKALYRGPAVVTNAETHEAIRIEDSGLENALQHGMNIQKRAVIAVLDKMLEGAAFVVRDTENMRPGVAAVETFAARVSIDDAHFVARLVVREVADGRRFYDHELSTLEMESARPTSNSGGSASASADRQSEPRPLVSLGKRILAQALAVNPDSVSKVVDENGEPRVVYHGTDADIESFSSDFLGRTTGAKSAKAGFFFASNPETADYYPQYDKDTVLYAYGFMRKKGETTAEYRRRMESPEGTPSGRLESAMHKYRATVQPAIAALNLSGRFAYSPKSQLDAYLLHGDPSRFAGQFRSSEIGDELEATGFFDAQDDKSPQEALELFEAEVARRVRAEGEAAIALKIDALDQDGRQALEAARAAAVVYRMAKKESDEFNFRYQWSKKSWSGGNQDGEVWEASKESQAPNIIPAFLAIKRPFIHDFKGKSYREVSYAELLEGAKVGDHDGATFLRTADPTPADIFVAFDPTQIKSAIGNLGTFDGANPNILESRSAGPAQWQAPEPSRLDDLIYSMQDKHVDMKRVVQSIKQTAGTIADNIDPYLQEELFHGRAAKAVKDFLDLELRPLIAEMRMRGVGMADFEEYLWNRHAEERNAQIAKINPQMPDGGSGLATADARAYLAGLSSDKRKAYESLAAKIDAITARNRQVLVDSGLEKAETVAAWEGAYKHYIPLQREDVETGGNGTGQGFSVRGTSSKRAVGSGRPVADIIANLAMQRERFIVKAEKNRVSIAIAGLAASNPNPDFWKLNEAPKERVVNNVALYNVLDANGNKVADFTRMDEAERMARSMGGEVEQTWSDRVQERIVPGFKNQENVVHFRLNGDDHFVVFNEREPRALRMAQSIKNLDMDQLGRVLTVAGKATRYFASINTQYNPIFGVINLFRDVQGALLNLSTTPLAGEQKRVAGYTVDALRGIYADIRAHRSGKVPSSRWASLYEEFQNEGGQTGYRDQFSNAEQRAEAIAKEIRSMDRNVAFKAAGAVFDWLSDYNQAMENAVRLAAYAAAKERGLSKQQAASLAKNLTVNFNRKGQVATQMGALYAFFNASMQGTARLAQTLTGPMGRRIITGGILLGSMQALLLASAGMGDDEPPEFVRERNLILPIGDGKYISLPMPLGFHVLPNLGRIPVEFVMSGFREPARRISDLVAIFADTFNPIGNAGLSLQTIAPTVVDPFAALAENKDWTGKPIAKMDMNANSPTPGHSRAKDTSTVWSKSIAEAINYLSGGTKYKPGVVSPTPDQIDYLIGQVTGGVGREAAKAEQTVTSTIFTGEELPLHKVPLVGRFVGDTKGQSAEGSKFYAALQRINEHENEIKGMRKDGRGAEIAGYIQDNPEARLMLYSNHVEREVQKLRAAKRDALERGDEGRVRMIESALTAKMRAFNERVRSAQGSAN